jgi:hypothetical protein
MGHFEPIGNRVFMTQRRQTMGHKNLFPVDAAGWELKVILLARDIRNPADLPPVIAEYLQGILYVRDGNHRHEALRRYGADRCWVLIWYNSEKDWMAHMVEGLSSG